MQGDSSKPWIAFYDSGDQHSEGTLREWAAWAHAGHTGFVERITELWSGRSPFTHNATASHVVTAFTRDTDSSPNPANNAVRQVLACASALENEWLRSQGPGQTGKVVLAVVVTGAPLFRCHLGASGEPELTRVGRAEVWGWSSKGQRRRVFVVTESELADFVSALQERASTAQR